MQLELNAVMGHDLYGGNMTGKKSSISLVSILTLGLFVLPLYGEVIVVPDNYARITDALNASGYGDTVLILPGVYSPSTNGETFPLSLPDGISMVGTNQDACIIDAEQTDRVLTCGGLSSPLTRLMRLTFRGGYSATYAAGLEIMNTDSLTIKNCRITANYALHNGGGMRLYYANDVSMEACVFDSNVSGLRGGGIYCQNSSPSIVECSFLSNYAHDGGGISCLGNSSPNITNATFEHNTVINQGGGIECYNESSPLVSGCLFRLNNALKGGGISIQNQSDATVIDNRFFDNSASNCGGAAFICNTGVAIFKRNLMNRNTCAGAGGAIVLTGPSHALIDSNIITHNTAGDTIDRGGGGGINCWNGPSPTITNNIIQYNISGMEGGGIHMHHDCSGLIENNTIQYNTTGLPGGTTGTGGGIFLFSANVIVRGNTISQNTAMISAGGIYVQDTIDEDTLNDARALVIENVITDNVSYRDGGGITTSEYDSSTIMGNIISNNVAIHGGGAMHVRFVAKTYIVENTIENNRAEGAGGGGIFITNSSKPTIIRNTISGNVALNNYYGGAISLITGTRANIFQNLIAFNTASCGGALHVRERGRAIVQRNVFTNNAADISGGAVYSYGEDAVLAMLNNTFYENRSQQNNSTMEIGASTYALIENNIISNEHGGEPLIIRNNQTALIHYNCFWNLVNDTVGPIYDTTRHNFFADPRFVDLFGLDFHLRDDSPCIDAGNPESPYDPDSTIADIGRFYFDQTFINEPEAGLFDAKPFPHLEVFPNPFRDKTLIKLQVPNPKLFTPLDGRHLTGQASSKFQTGLKIYDATGTLVRDFSLAASYSLLATQVSWDGKDSQGRNLPSGVYFVKLQTNAFEATKKILLVK